MISDGDGGKVFSYLLCMAHRLGSFTRAQRWGSIVPEANFEKESARLITRWDTRQLYFIHSGLRTEQRIVW